MLNRIPETWSPNSLTLAATVACAASFLLAALANESTAAMLVAALLVFAYVSLDNMDGAQARRTDRSSRLGEFLDHWLDTLNNGFVVLGACFAVGLGPLLTLLVFLATTLAFFGVQLELRQTGVFRMGRVADIEGNTGVSLLYIGIALVGREFFDWVPVEGLPSLAFLIGLGVMGQALWTFAMAFRRLEGGRLDFLPISLCAAVLIGWFLSGSISSAVVLTIAYFVNPVFTSRPILGRLLGRSTVSTDWLSVAVVTCGALLAMGRDGSSVGWVVALTMFALTSTHALRAISALRAEEDSVATASV